MAELTNTSATPVQAQMSFPVYMIHSGWSIPKLDLFLNGYGAAGYLRVVYDHNGKETSQTIAMLTKQAYDALCKDGYSGQGRGRGFKITPYTLNSYSYPSKDSTETLFVPVPKTLSVDDTSVITTIEDKLSHLAEWGIIPNGSWTINVPLQSRELGGVRVGCFITFKREVTLDQKAMVRILMNDTYWPETNTSTERSILRCRWAHNQRSNAKSDRKGKTEVKQEEKEPKTEKAAIQKIANHAKPVGRTVTKKDEKSDKAVETNKPIKTVKQRKFQSNEKQTTYVPKKAPTIPMIPISEQPTLKEESQ